MLLKFLSNGIHGCILLQIELKKHDLEKYDWQKPHQSNLTGTNKLIIQIKIKKMSLIKNIKVGNLNKLNYHIFYLYFFYSNFSFTNN